MSRVLGFHHLKLKEGADTNALEKFLKEQAFPYWEQIPGLKCHLVKGKGGDILQDGEYYWVNEAESEERYAGFWPTPDEQWERHYEAGLKMHGETWNQLIEAFPYMGSMLVL